MGTHKVLFQYNRLPFGISSAPAVFQRCIESLLQGCEGVSVYLDDILVTSATIESHLANLDKILGILATSGLRLNKAKRAFMLPSHTWVIQLMNMGQGKGQGNPRSPTTTQCSRAEVILGIINYI